MRRQYRLPYILREPCEETEDLYLAEVPLLPGCRAWGTTPEEATFNLEGVAADFIASYRDHDDDLPVASPPTSWSSRFDLPGTYAQVKGCGL